jgi:tetratricopeptide (TPR) repeat protein
MNSFINDVETEIEALNKAIENDITLGKSKETKLKVDTLTKKIDNYVNESQEEKSVKARLFFYKGKALNLLNDYTKDAEDALSKSLKLNPKDKDTWNILGDILWKKKDYGGAKKTFEAAIEQCGKNKVSLRSLSLVIRCIEETKEKNENVKKSIDYAKEAVALDLKDGESWYILGNAYLSSYFVNVKKLDELQSALKAYNQAEAHLTAKNPDLYYNRGQIQLYLEDFDKAIDNYQKADSLDPNLNAKERINRILETVKAIDNVLQTKGKIKSKKLTNIIRSIPCVLKTQPQQLGNVNYDVKSLEELKSGPNKGSILSCKIMGVVSNKGDVPAKFVFVDFKANFGNLSVYHCSDDIYDQVREQSDIYVIDPNVKDVKVPLFDRVVEYRSVQLFDPESIYIDQQKAKNIFSPSQIVNKAV